MSRTPCVVVASESSDGRQNIAGMLSEEHWHVVGAADGETAVELVHARTADLLLIDTHLRDRSGLDVCRRLRHEVESRLFPIVVISNQDDISSRVAALEAGADDFLSRPIERNELIARDLVGAEIVAPLTSQRDLVAIVRNHHERFDGGGYPDRLRGEAIPLAARIVAVCDAFDAMTNQRPYRPAMPYPRALSILKAGRGRQWDTALVDAFVTILEQR